MPRFSTLAVGAVGALLVAGTINGYLQVREWQGLWETTYGLLLLAKIALVLPLLALGAFNNRYASCRGSGRESPPPSSGAGSSRAVSAELALMTVIVGVTAVLVSAPPARGELEDARSRRGGRRPRADRGARHGRPGDGRAQHDPSSS